MSESNETPLAELVAGVIFVHRKMVALVVPESRERAIALTKMDEACMWLMAAADQRVEE